MSPLQRRSQSLDLCDDDDDINRNVSVTERRRDNDDDDVNKENIKRPSDDTKTTEGQQNIDALCLLAVHVHMWR